MWRSTFRWKFRRDASGRLVYLQVADTQADRQIVEIFREADDHLVATVTAIPATREHATDDTVFTFEERPGDQPPANGSRVEPGWPNPFHYVVVIPLPEPEPANAPATDVE